MIAIIKFSKIARFKLDSKQKNRNILADTSDAFDRVYRAYFFLKCARSWHVR